MTALRVLRRLWAFWEALWGILCLTIQNAYDALLQGARATAAALWAVLWAWVELPALVYQAVYGEAVPSDVVFRYCWWLLLHLMYLGVAAAVVQLLR
jgi:hypothetical protein